MRPPLLLTALLAGTGLVLVSSLVLLVAVVAEKNNSAVPSAMHAATSADTAAAAAAAADGQSAAAVEQERRRNQITTITTTTIPEPGISLVKTVALDSASCTNGDGLATHNLEVAALDTTVTFCFNITNTGSVTLTDVTLKDDQLQLAATYPSLLAGRSIVHTGQHVVTAVNLVNTAYVYGVATLERTEGDTTTIAQPIIRRLEEAEESGDRHHRRDQLTTTTSTYQTEVNSTDTATVVVSGLKEVATPAPTPLSVAKASGGTASLSIEKSMTLGGGSCPGSPTLGFADGGPHEVTFCYRVVNTGDYTMTQIRLWDPDLKHLLTYKNVPAGGSGPSSGYDSVTSYVGQSLTGETTSWGYPVYVEGVSDISAANSVDAPPVSAPVNLPVQRHNLAVWKRGGQNDPRFAYWDENSGVFNPTSGGLVMGGDPLGQWRIIQGAESPFGDETIVMGVADGSGEIGGKVLTENNAKLVVWEDIQVPTSTGSTKILATASQTYWWSFDVKYESQSGRSMMVWANGESGFASISFSVGTGQNAWTTVEDIVLPSEGIVRQLQLASCPTRDEMILVASNTNTNTGDEAKFAMVWDGTAWGSPRILYDVGSADDHTDVNVAYSSLSGAAVIVYGANSIDLKYTTWTGSAWGGLGGIINNLGVTGNVRWTVVASDPSSDRILVGVLTQNSEIWTISWSGTSWSNSGVHTTSALGTTFPAVAVAYEAKSGKGLVAFGVSGQSSISYSKLYASGGILSTAVGPTLPDVPNSIRLSPDPTSNQILAFAQTQGNSLEYAMWDGDSSLWTTATTLETKTGETKNQPFLFLWDADPVVADTEEPSSTPSASPSYVPSALPSNAPSLSPTSSPTSMPTSMPSNIPSLVPSRSPSTAPTLQHSNRPSLPPSAGPSEIPSRSPSGLPTAVPSSGPSSSPSLSFEPTPVPSSVPSLSSVPTEEHSYGPSVSSAPSSRPSQKVSQKPSALLSKDPSSAPSRMPTMKYSGAPSDMPSTDPSSRPSTGPSTGPSALPSNSPTSKPTVSNRPSMHYQPSDVPSISAQPSPTPSSRPSSAPFASPSVVPTSSPSAVPTEDPSPRPSVSPSASPSLRPSVALSNMPSVAESGAPSVEPSTAPSVVASQFPSAMFSDEPSKSFVPTLMGSARPSVSPEPSIMDSLSPSMSLSPSSAPSGRPSQSMLPTFETSGQPSVSSSPTLVGSEAPSKSLLPSSTPSAASDAPSEQRPPSFELIWNHALATFSPTGTRSDHPSESSHPPSMVPVPETSSVPALLPSAAPVSDSTPPSMISSAGPSFLGSSEPSVEPSASPVTITSNVPSGHPSVSPESPEAKEDTRVATDRPSRAPDVAESLLPSSSPVAAISSGPSSKPSEFPVVESSNKPSASPVVAVSSIPSSYLSASPTEMVSGGPSLQPSDSPVVAASSGPSVAPSASPVAMEIEAPSSQPSASPVIAASTGPSSHPSAAPVVMESAIPSVTASGRPSSMRSDRPTVSQMPTTAGSEAPSTSRMPIVVDFNSPSEATASPSASSSLTPSISGSDKSSTISEEPSVSFGPSRNPTMVASERPSWEESAMPSTESATDEPSNYSTIKSSLPPSLEISLNPSSVNSENPSAAASQQSSSLPTAVASSSSPSEQESHGPSASSSATPSSAVVTAFPSAHAAVAESQAPSSVPSKRPVIMNSSAPSNFPSSKSAVPSTVPSNRVISEYPTTQPSTQAPIPSPLVQTAAFSTIDADQKFTSGEYTSPSQSFSSIYFVAADPSVGATEMIWWILSGFRSSGPISARLIATCPNDGRVGNPSGEAISVEFKASQRTCEDHWQFNAIRFENTCPHVLQIDLDRSTSANSWSERTDLYGCELRSESEIDFSVRSYSQSEDGSETQDALVDTIRMMVKVSVERMPTASPSAKPSEGAVISGAGSDLDSTNSPSIGSTSSPTLAPMRQTPLPTILALTEGPSTSPTEMPTMSPTGSPTESPSERPTPVPTGQPTPSPSRRPSTRPSPSPTTAQPSPKPSPIPTVTPGNPTASPTTKKPSFSPTNAPTSRSPTPRPTAMPSKRPSLRPTTRSPTTSPSSRPSVTPGEPSKSPMTPKPTTKTPTPGPSYSSESPSSPSPTQGPTQAPTKAPLSLKPSAHPSLSSLAPSTETVNTETPSTLVGDSIPQQYVATPVAEITAAPSLGIGENIEESNEPSSSPSMTSASEEPSRIIEDSPIPSAAQTQIPYDDIVMNDVIVVGVSDGDSVASDAGGTSSPTIATGTPSPGPSATATVTSSTIEANREVGNGSAPTMAQDAPSASPLIVNEAGTPDGSGTESGGGSIQGNGVATVRQSTDLLHSAAISYSPSVSTDQVILDVELAIGESLNQLIVDHESTMGILAQYNVAIDSVQAKEKVDSTCLSSLLTDGQCIDVAITVTASFDEGISEGQIKFILSEHLERVVNELRSDYTIDDFGPRVAMADAGFMILGVDQLPNEEGISVFEDVVGDYLNEQLGADLTQPITDVAVEVVDVVVINDDQLVRRRLQYRPGTAAREMKKDIIVGVETVVTGRYRGPRIDDMDRKINDAIDGYSYKIDSELNKRSRYYERAIVLQSSSTDGDNEASTPPVAAPTDSTPTNSPTVGIEDTSPSSGIPNDNKRRKGLAGIAVVMAAIAIFALAGALYMTKRSRERAHNDPAGATGDAFDVADCVPWSPAGHGVEVYNGRSFRDQARARMWNSFSNSVSTDISSLADPVGMDDVSATDSNDARSRRSDIISSLEEDETAFKSQAKSGLTSEDTPGAYSVRPRVERVNSWKEAFDKMKMWRKEGGELPDDGWNNPCEEASVPVTRGNEDDDHVSEASSSVADGADTTTTGKKSVSFARNIVDAIFSEHSSRGGDRSAVTCTSFGGGQQRHGRFDDDDEDDDEEEDSHDRYNRNDDGLSGYDVW